VDPPESKLPWEFQATRQARVAETRRRERRRLILLSLAAVVSLVVIGAAAGFLAGNDGTGDAPTRRAVAPPSTTSTTSPVTEECRAPLTFGDPLRLWIGGDSLAGSLGPALGEQTADTGVVLPTYDGRTSSGLSNPDFFDWPEHGAAEMAELDPEIVVFIIGANDFDVPDDQPVDARGVPAWRARYARLIENMLGILEADGRHVYWIGPPIMREKRKGDGARELNDLMQEVIARHPDVIYLDAFELFSDEDGEYTATLPGTDGEDVRVRAADGIHLTVAGAEFLAEQVFTLIDRRCQVVDQSLPGQRQPIKRTPGSSPDGEGKAPTAPSTSAPSFTSTTLPFTPTTPPSTATPPSTLLVP
jgi:hypothetical protein